MTTIDRSRIGKSISVVDDIDDGSRQMLSDKLEDVEGLRVKRIDGDAGLTTIRVRGARSIDTLLLFDGMPFVDASDPQGSSNPLIGDLGAAGFGRVEVLRGPSSSTYGSSAIGGVVNMLPSERRGMFAGAEIGSGRTFREWAGIGRELGDYGNHNMTFERTDSDGFDAHDEYGRTQVVGKSNFGLGEKWKAAVAYLFGRTDAALNRAPGVKGGELQTSRDDENDTREYSVASFTGSLEGGVADGVSVSVRSALTSTERRFTFLPNADGSGFLSDGTFAGDAFTLQEKVSVEHNGMFSTAVGHQFQREWLTQKTFLNGQTDFFGSPLSDMTDETDQFSNDFFAEESIRIGRATVILGARQNTHESAKGRATWDAAVSYILPSFTVLRAHYGTAYREPSLFELNGSFLSSFGRFEVGNENLSPERSAGYDFGFEHPWKRGVFGATFFSSKTSNRIDFVGFGYENVPGRTETHGVESFFAVDLSKEISLRVSSTEVLGDRLIDVPRHQIGARIAADFGKLKLTAAGVRIGGHRIQVFNEDTFMVDELGEKGHTLVSAQVSYDLAKHATIYIRGENLLNEDYTDGGYNAPGARVYGGVVASF